MAAAEADPAQPLCFLDTAHPTYGAHPAYGRIRRGETRTLKSNHGRADVALNGALGWPAREAVAREAQKITGLGMVAFLQDLEARHPTAAAIAVVLDNAACNRAAVVREWLAGPGRRIRLVYLPPCAPYLNLTELLWWFFKKKALWNIHYPTLADFTAAIRGFFGDFQRWALEPASLITNRLHFIGAERSQIPTA